MAFAALGSVLTAFGTSSYSCSSSQPPLNSAVAVMSALSDTSPQMCSSRRRGPRFSQTRTSSRRNVFQTCCQSLLVILQE